VQSEILALLRDIRAQRQMALVLITHDLPLAGGVCDRIAVMRHGQVVETGTVNDKFSQPQHVYTRELLLASRY
jgi:ABC-type dipeptide/oligopeptide/nickel transport system ATPase component